MRDPKADQYQVWSQGEYTGRSHASLKVAIRDAQPLAVGEVVDNDTGEVLYMEGGFDGYCPPEASDPRYYAGQLLRVVTGPFRGRVVKVSSKSYWTPKTFYEGDPTKGICTPQGWQVVLEIQDPEGAAFPAWLDLCRENEAEVARLTKAVA